jgi:hypothetical protein
MNREGFGSNWSWPYRVTVPAFAWRDWRKLRKSWVRIACVWDEIRSKHHSNTSLEPYSESNLLGNHAVNIGCGAQLHDQSLCNCLHFSAVLSHIRQHILFSTFNFIIINLHSLLIPHLILRQYASEWTGTNTSECSSVSLRYDYPHTKIV